MLENEKYQTLKQSRIDITDKIYELFENCNDMIQRENKMFKQLQQRENQQNRIDKNVKTLKSSLQSCLSVIEAYDEFIAQNNKYINQIKANFEESWNEFESTWMQWNVPEIIIWLKFSTRDCEESNINWEAIETQLNEREIKGQSLREFKVVRDLVVLEF